MLKCGYNFADYKPKRKPNKKLRRWEELNEKEQYVSMKEVELQELDKKIRLANKQLAKLKIAINDNDKKDINRQTNRLNKTIEKLSPSLEASYEQELQLLREEIEKIEPRANRPILTVKNKLKLKK